MKVLQDKYEGDFLIDADTEIRGMITGSVSVSPHKYVRLTGMICKDVTVNPDARIDIHGTVIGQIRNLGGDVKIYGIVGGVEDLGPTKSWIDSKAIMTGTRN